MGRPKSLVACWRGLTGCRQLSAARPQSLAAGRVDDEVAISLQDGTGSGGGISVRLPEGAPARGVDHEVAISPHDGVGIGIAVRVALPERQFSLVHNEIAVSLHDEVVPAVDRGQVLPRIEALSG